MALTPVGDGVYHGELNEHWTIGPKVHGGAMLALCANAARTEHGADRGVRQFFVGLNQGDRTAVRAAVTLGDPEHHVPPLLSVNPVIPLMQPARRCKLARTGSMRITSSWTARATSSCRPANWRWCLPRSSGRPSAMLAAMARIAIIGGGSIGEALLSGLLRAGRQVKDLVVAEKSPDRVKYLSDTYSVLVTTVADAVDTAAYVIVAVKPSDAGAVVAEIAEAAAQAESDAVEQVFVSVVAGVTTEFYENKLPAGSPVIRVMPNAPVIVGGGVSALARGRFATAEQLKEVSAIFDAVGGVLTVPESQLDAVTAVSGSGPAYFFLMVEALVDAGVAAGLTRAVSTDLVVQTMAGSAAMLLERLDRAQPAGDAGGSSLGSALDTTAAQLRATITSPGGTTAAGLRELERGGLRAAVADAVDAAKRRSEQLGITSE